MRSMIVSRSDKTKLLIILFGFIAAAIMTACGSAEYSETDSGGSSSSRVCYKECPYVGWGALLTPSCWETVPCASSATALSCGEKEQPVTLEPVILLLGESSPEGNVSLELGGSTVRVTDPEMSVVLTNLTTGMSWLAEVSQDSFHDGYLQWSAIAPLDGYAAIYGENRFVVELFNVDLIDSAETTVEVGYW